MEANNPSGFPDFEVLHSLEYLNSVRHPVYFGEIINNRYRVLRRLGAGHHGYVWLVEDLKLTRFAALKVLNTDASSVSSEIKVSKYLQSHQERDIAHPGREHVVKILDTFITNDPNGTHHCIVTELLGISMAKENRQFYKDRRNEYPPDITRKVAAQVVLAVSYLHECGVIHGDLSLGNVLFYSPKLQSFSHQELSTFYGPPADSFSIPYDTFNLFTSCLSSLDDIHAKICDFSAATLISEVPAVDRPFVPYMPVVSAAPEVIFNDIAYPTTLMDIWALGVLLFMIMNSKYPPFFTFYNVAEEVVESIVVFLGKLPDKWWTKWSERAEYFDDEGVSLDENMHICRIKGINGIANSLHHMDVRQEFSEDERESFTRILSKIFRYDPEERIGADEVVRLLPRDWVNPQAFEKSIRAGNGGAVDVFDDRIQ